VHGESYRVRHGKGLTFIGRIRLELLSATGARRCGLIQPLREDLFGEPNVRQLEPDRRLAAATRPLPLGCLTQGPYVSRSSDIRVKHPKSDAPAPRRPGETGSPLAEPTQEFPVKHTGHVVRPIRVRLAGE
jgi:hypothetical protein